MPGVVRDCQTSQTQTAQLVRSIPHTKQNKTTVSRLLMIGGGLESLSDAARCWSSGLGAGAGAGDGAGAAVGASKIEEPLKLDCVTCIRQQQMQERHVSRNAHEAVYLRPRDSSWETACGGVAQNEGERSISGACFAAQSAAARVRQSRR